MKYYIIGIIVIAVIIIILTNNTKKPQTQYKAKGAIFTKNEFPFFMELNKAIEQKELAIFPKVRLADIIEPKNHDSTWQTHFNKICSKHVDFLLCDTKTYTPKLIIELDDKSHDRTDRQERDAFVDQALGQAGIPIIHTRNSEGLREKIEKGLSPTL